MNAEPQTDRGTRLEDGFRLDELAIDPRAGEISGPGGTGKLDPKVMDVLVLLAEHAGRVVLREDLLARLWPKAVVGDDALSRCIYELRRHLNLAAGDERCKSMVETLPKRGYRLHGKIDTPLHRSVTPEPELASQTAAPAPQTAIAAKQPQNGRLLVIAGTLLLAGLVWLANTRTTPPEKVALGAPPWPGKAIAVLPFVDMSETHDQAYLSDGVAEEILDRLTRIDGLRVIARTSSFRFGNQSADIREIATKLNVSHVLEGSVRKSGEHVRITIQLVDAASNSHVWSKTYDRALSDLFAMQDEIAASVAKELDLSLGPTMRDSRAPASAEAHRLLLQGQFFYNRRGTGDVVRSTKYYQQALNIDPNYAKAWAALAGSYSILAQSGEMPRAIARAKQGDAAQRAVALDPLDADGHYRLAGFYFEGGDRELACKETEIAATLASMPSHCLDRHPTPADLADLIDQSERQIARDPLSLIARRNLGVYLFAEGRLEEANSTFLKVLEINPDDKEAPLELARIFVTQKRYDEAYSATTHLPPGPYRDHLLALLNAAPGHEAEADAALKRLNEGTQSEAIDNVRLAEVYTHRGMNDEAIATLRDYRNSIDPSSELRYSRIWWHQQEMSVAPFLMPLHRDPRWDLLMADPL